MATRISPEILKSLKRDFDKFRIAEQSVPETRGADGDLMERWLRTKKRVRRHRMLTHKKRR